MRILFYKSDELLDSALPPNVIDQALVNTPATPKYSLPFRLCGSREPVEEYEAELLFFDPTGLLPAGTTMEARFRRELYTRTWDPDTRPTANWLRQRDLVDAGAGVSNILEREYRALLTLDEPLIVTGFTTRAAWERLAVWIAGAIPAGAELSIHLHLGGHLYADYLETLLRPYAYNRPV